MNAGTRLSVLGTVLLVAAMVLPMYTCDGYRSPSGAAPA
jgi:hypothetical protein